MVAAGVLYYVLCALHIPSQCIVDDSMVAMCSVGLGFGFCVLRNGALVSGFLQLELQDKRWNQKSKVELKKFAANCQLQLPPMRK